jgi:hypothetical protein
VEYHDRYQTAVFTRGRAKELYTHLLIVYIDQSSDDCSSLPWMFEAHYNDYGTPMIRCRRKLRGNQEESYKFGPDNNSALGISTREAKEVGRIDSIASDEADT